MSGQINTLEFSCTCGLKIRARPDQGGKLYKCPSCGASIQVPKVTVDAAEHSLPYTPPRAPAAPPAAKSCPLELPTSVGRFILYLAAAWIVLTMVCLLVSFISVLSEVLATGIFVSATGVIGHQVWILLRARQRVLTQKNVRVLWGFVRLIAWDPVEGILTLKNKSVDFCDDNLEDGRGGVRFIYSILGEELALRAPLEVQTLQFCDENVLTREFLVVTIRGTMKWRIVDIRKFYLLVSRELRSTTNHDEREQISTTTPTAAVKDPGGEPSNRKLLAAAISWMQVLVEEETRNVVSKARSGLLIADRLSQELFPQLRGNHDGPADAEPGGAADSLAGAIHDTVARRLEAYGIAVEDVSLQEMKLPEEIMRECVEACRSYYYPTIAKRKAAFKFEEMQAQASVIGRDAMAAKEVAGAAPAFAISDFLTQYLQKRMSAATATADDPAVSAALAAGIARAALPQRPEKIGEGRAGNGEGEKG